MALTQEQADKIKENLLSQLTKLPAEQVGELKGKIQAMNSEELEKFIAEQQKAQQLQGKQGEPGKKQKEKGRYKP